MAAQKENDAKLFLWILFRESDWKTDVLSTLRIWKRVVHKTGFTFQCVEISSTCRNSKYPRIRGEVILPGSLTLNAWPSHKERMHGFCIP